MATTHGKGKSAEAAIWRNMIYRTRNPNASNYAKYGGRGIKVCARWLQGFTNFYEDMGPRPSPRHSVDRIDNDGDYTPENCRWATLEEQGQNRRDNLLIKSNGEVKCVSEWSRVTGLKENTIRRRVDVGWPEERLLEPARPWKRKVSNEQPV